MHLKQIVLDGFKSYANRTVIDGFDRSFNAITGQNGSGKSNVLDAICFVLGITNLSKVRATEIKDLVYKSGQARVTKCSVTLVFDNSEPEGSPHGYREFKEITITRQYSIAGEVNKYFINGKNAQQNKVQQLFKSVQLNVNNPQFLIMQGSITKVCNMKPNELLGLLEETCGVKLYEEHRNNAQRKIQQREGKLLEIEEALKSIQESRDQFEEEKRRYNTSEQLRSKVEKLQRFVDAITYFESQRTQASLKDEMKRLQLDQTQMATRYELICEELRKLEASTALLKSNNAKSQKVKDLNNKLSHEHTELGRLESKKEADLSLLTGLKKDISTVQSKIEKANVKAKDLSTTKSIEKHFVEAQARYQQEKSLVDSLNASISGALTSDNGETKAQTLRDQLMECERELQRIQSRTHQIQSQLKSLDIKKRKIEQSAELEKEKQAGLERNIADKEYNLRQKLNRVQSEEQLKGIKILQNAPRESSSANTNEMSDSSSSSSMSDSASHPRRSSLGLDFPILSQQIADGVMRQQLQEQRHRLRMEVSQQQDLVERDSSDIANRLSFRFDPATCRVNPASVSGPLARLITVEDHANAYALEITAGNKLYQIVVDTDETSSNLLKYGQFRNRITIIPLNKINGQRVDDNLEQNVKRLVGNRAVPAINLINCGNEYRRAAEYAFGKTFICQDIQAAETIAYNAAIRCKAVTLVGDVYDPAGTISGGSRTQSFSILAAVATLNQKRRKLEELQKMEEDAKIKLESFSILESAAHDYQSDLESLKMMKKSLETTSFSHLKQEASQIGSQMISLKEELENIEKAHVFAIERQKTVKNAVNILESSAASNDQHAMQRQLDQATQNMKTAEDHLRKLEKAFDHSKAQDEALQLDIEKSEKDLQSLIQNGRDLQTRVDAIQVEIQTQKNAVEKIKMELESEYSKIKEVTKQLEQTEKNHEKLRVDKDDAHDQQKKIAKDLEEKDKYLRNSVYGLNELLKRAPWVERESATFDVPDSEFDFRGRNRQQSAADLDQYQSELEKLLRRVNKTAALQFDKMNTKYQELKKQRDQIIADRENIDMTISELDLQKNKMLMLTWTAVNASLSRIFSVLLPGTNAQLERQMSPDGLFLTGVELRVAFGGRWKESLSELSGGQRSLLALSLILSLLLYKPAPMYILDEVDAALDLAHTQNIGAVIKKEFGMSQFIIVSLKEGMFNNANVLFRTKFQDGISSIAVERSTN